jgi:lysophospholipase L1-like esterase
MAASTSLSTAEDRTRTLHAPLYHRYVAIGDSLSEGLGDPLPGGQVGGWAKELARMLRGRNPDIRFTNLAIRGHMAVHALRRQIARGVAEDPDLVSIFIGGNDVMFRRRFDAARFAEEVEQLVRPFARPGVTVVLSTLPDLTACSLLPPPLRGRLRKRIVAANDVIREASREHGTLLLDAWADERTRHHGMWSIDRIHPSAAGHRLIARGVAELLGMVPAEPAAVLRERPLTTVTRHAREAAWLIRYVRRLPAV